MNKKKVLAGTLYCLMMAYAFSVTAVGPLLPVLMADYQIPLREAGLFSLFQGGGGILGLLLGVMFASYIRLDHMVKALAGIYCASLLALGIKMAFLAMLILFFIIGASTKLLDSTLNAYVSELYPADSSKHLSILHACFGMGALLAPLIIAFLLERNMPARRVFAALGIICLAIQCAYYGGQRACPTPAKTEPLKPGQLWEVLKNRHILFLCLCVMSYTGFSCGCSMWVPSYMKSCLGACTTEANYPIYALWMGIILGRLFCARYSQRFNAYRYIIGANLLGGAAIIGATALDAVLAYISAYFIAGFTAGGVVPIAVAIANGRYPAYKSSVSAIITLAAAVGFMLFPSLVGVVAEADFWRGIGLLNIFPVCIAVCMLMAGRAARNYKNENERSNRL